MRVLNTKKARLSNAFAARSQYLNLEKLRRVFVLRATRDQGVNQAQYEEKTQTYWPKDKADTTINDKFSHLLEYLYDQKYLLDQDNDHFSAEVLRSLHRETVLHTLWKQFALIMLLSLIITGFIYGVTFGLIML